MERELFGLSLTERSLARISDYGCIEYTVAVELEKLGLIEICEDIFDLDALGYPYPHGAVALQTLTYFNRTDLGTIRLITRNSDLSELHFRYKKVSRSPISTKFTDRVIFQKAELLRMIEVGRRDEVLALNKVEAAPKTLEDFDKPDAPPSSLDGVEKHR